MNTDQKLKEICDRHFSDPERAKVLDQFFEEIFRIGDIDKTILTVHGRITVLDGPPDGKKPRSNPFDETL